jgi:hypothetical protein
MKRYWPSLLFSLGILALVACNGAPLAPPPQISEPDPRVLELAARIGQPDTGSFSFTNVGEAGLTYTVSVPPEAPWLVPTAGAAGGLAPGETATVGLQATCPDTPASLNTQVSIILNALARAALFGPLPDAGLADGR